MCYSGQQVHHPALLSQPKQEEKVEIRVHIQNIVLGSVAHTS
jgi:hypothetical protein